MSILKKILLILLVGTASLCVMATIVYFSVQLKFPSAAELDSISLELPQIEPMSNGVEFFLKDKSLESLFAKVDFETLEKEYQPGEWFKDPQNIQRTLEGLEAFRKTGLSNLSIPGCLPAPENLEVTDPIYQYGRIPNLASLQVFMVMSSIQMKSSQTFQYIQELETLQKRLVQLEQECAPSLVQSMLILVSLKILQEAWSYVIVWSNSETQTKETVDPWLALLELENRRSPVVDGLKHQFKALFEFEESTVERLKKDFPAQIIRMFYNSENTRQTLTRLAKRSVWLAQQGFAHPSWSKPTPEENFAKEFGDLPKWKFIFQRNIIGRGYLLSVFAEPFRKYTWKWHQVNCQMIARRTRWVEDAKSRKIRIPSRLGEKAGLNPFTNQAFIPGKVTQNTCAIPKKFYGSSKYKEKPLEPYSLPRSLP